MLKNILNLKGAQQLTKSEQKSINGGITENCRLGAIGENGEWDPSSCPAGFPFIRILRGIHYCCAS